MNITDDLRIENLARDPAKELLPSDRHILALRPLIFLMAFVPGLLTFQAGYLSGPTAQEGIHALELLNAGIVRSPKDNKDDDQASAVRNWTPTLLATGMSLNVSPLLPEQRLLIVPYFCAAFLAISLFVAARESGGLSLGFFSVLLGFCHRDFLALTASLPPLSLGLATSLLTFAGVLRHQTVDRWWTRHLIFSGLSLGLSWLISAPLAIQCVAVVLLQSLSSSILNIANQESKETHLVIRLVLVFARSAFGLLFVLVIAGLLVIGWHSVVSTLPLRSLPESVFQAAQSWRFTTQFTLSRDVSFDRVCNSLLEMSGPLVGSCLFGFFDSLLTSFRKQSVSERRSDQFLLILWFLSFAVWLSAWPSHQGDFVSTDPSCTFLLIPMTLFGARGVEGILKRRFNPLIVLLVSAISFSTALVNPLTSQGYGSLRNWALILSVISGAALTIFLVIERKNSAEFRHRRILVTCIAVCIALNVAIGITSSPRRNADERELSILRRHLYGEKRRPDECVVIVDEPLPPRLLFFIRTLWNGTKIRVTDTWELATEESGEPATRIIFTWGDLRSAANTKPRTQQLTSAAAPHFFERRQLKSFWWNSVTMLDKTAHQGATINSGKQAKSGLAIRK